MITIIPYLSMISSVLQNILINTINTESSEMKGNIGTTLVRENVEIYLVNY